MVRAMILRRLLLAVPLLLLPLVAAADSFAPPVTFEVLPGWRTAQGTHIAAFRFRLAPGWKTYWRAPGEAGIPPRVDWTGSENIATAGFRWPAPEVFDLNGMRSIGYHDGLVLPIELTLPDPSSNAELRGRIEIGVCEDICVPVAFDFAVTLPDGGARDPLIVAALVDRPMTGAEAGMGPITCALSPSKDGLHVAASLPIADTGGREVVVIEAGNDDIWVSETTVTRTGGALAVGADMVHYSGGAFAIDRSAIRFTVLGRDRTVEVEGCSAG